MTKLTEIGRVNRSLEQRVKGQVRLRGRDDYAADTMRRSGDYLPVNQCQLASKGNQ
jgi:hypothetical protein